MASGRIPPQGPAVHIAVTSTPHAPLSLGTRFVRGAWWSLVGMGAAQGLAVLASIVTARLLGKVTFGEFGMVTGTVGAFGMLAGFGLGLTATKFVAERAGHRSGSRRSHSGSGRSGGIDLRGRGGTRSSLPPRPGSRQEL